MTSAKDVGILWAIVLFIIVIIYIFWDWVRGEWPIWRYRQRLKQKGQVSEESYKLRPESLFIIQISEAEVSCTRPNGEFEKVDWNDLVSVEIITTDKGPFLPDVFWVLHGSSTGCMIPQGATGETELLNRLQKLPGFQNYVLIKAMMSMENARFLCWQKG
jgi:hypothetical protein